MIQEVIFQALASGHSEAQIKKELISQGEDNPSMMIGALTDIIFKLIKHEIDEDGNYIDTGGWPF